MEEKYSNMIKEAQKIFDSIMEESLFVQEGTLYGEQQQMTSCIKQNIKICLTDNT